MSRFFWGKKQSSIENNYVPTSTYRSADNALVAVAADNVRGIRKPTTFIIIMRKELAEEEG